MRIAYVAGWMRSGTTLVGEVLGSMPGAVAIGELSGVWREAASGRPCSCGARLSDCPLWGPALEAVSAEHGIRESDRVGVAELARRVLRTRKAGQLAKLAQQSRRDWPQEVRRYVAITSTLLRSIAERTGAHVIVDSSKLPPGFLTAALVPGAEVRVVHIVRDPRAVAHSELKTRHRQGAEKELLPPGRSALSSAYCWTGFNLAVNRHAHRADAYVRVSYEDFAAQPQDASTNLARFLGLPPGLTWRADGVIKLAESHLAVGNPNRFATRERTIRPDLAWREQMRPRDRLLVTGLTSPARPLLRPTRVPRPAGSD